MGYDVLGAGKGEISCDCTELRGEIERGIIDI